MKPAWQVHVKFPAVSPQQVAFGWQSWLPSLHLSTSNICKPGEKEKSKVNDHMTRRTMANSSAWPSFLRNHHSRAFDNGQRLIKQNSNITLEALRTKLQIIYYSLVSHSQKSLEHTENQTNYRKMTRKPQSPGRILIYRTCRAFRKIQKKFKYCCNRVTLIFLICPFHITPLPSESVWSYNAAYASSLRFAFQNRRVVCDVFFMSWPRVNLWLIIKM